MVVVSVGWLLFQDQCGIFFVLQVGLCLSASHDVIEMGVGRWCLHRFVFSFSESQESNNEYGCSYSVMRVVGNGSTVILNSISLSILSYDQLKCNGQPAVFCLRTVYTCISVTCRRKSNTGYHYAFNMYILYVDNNNNNNTYKIYSIMILVIDWVRF